MACNCDYPMAHCTEHDPTPWTRAGYTEGGEKLPGDEVVARMYVEALVAAGKAQDLMEAYSDHNQSCFYVHGIVRHVAEEGWPGLSAQDFARNLLEDWSK